MLCHKENSEEMKAVNSCLEQCYNRYLRPQYNNLQQKIGYATVGLTYATISSVIIIAATANENHEQLKRKAISVLLALTVLEALVGYLCFRLGRRPIYEVIADEPLLPDDDAESKVSYVSLA